MKRFLIILAVIALLGTAAYLGWRFFKPRLATPGGGPTPSPTGSLPLPPSPVLRTLSEKPVFAYWMDQRTETLYYLTEAGEIYKVTVGSQAVKINDQPIENLQTAVPSPNGASVLISFGSAEHILFSLFNTEHPSWQPLPTDTVAAAWNPTGEILLLLSKTPDKSVLQTFSVRELTVRELTPLNATDIDLFWPRPDDIYLVDRPSAQVFGSLWKFNIREKKLRPVARDEAGLMVRWAPDGTRALKFSLIEQRQSSLTLLDGTDRFLAAFPLTKTLPLKCLVGNPVSYCGVPTEVSPRDLWPDDYLMRNVHYEDSIISWNAATNEIRALYPAEGGSIDVEQLTLSQNKLLFVNRFDRRLYEFTLPAPAEEPPAAPVGGEETP